MKDYFSQDSEQYKRYRPRYPESLFSYLSTLTPFHKCAWDCATGNGQAALALSPFYEHIIATDISINQLSQCAQPPSNIKFRQKSAEQSDIEDASVDLITVAQALHWFDIDLFAAECKRVLKGRGILVVWTYNLLTIELSLDALIKHLYFSILSDYWPVERKLVEQNYASITMPFDELTVPRFDMQAHWDAHQLIGYLSTWSALKLYIKKNSHNPLESLKPRILDCWGAEDEKRLIRWPLTVRIWRMTNT